MDRYVWTSIYYVIGNIGYIFIQSNDVLQPKFNYCQNMYVYFNNVFKICKSDYLIFYCKNKR